MINVKQICYSIQDSPILSDVSFTTGSCGVFHIQADNGAGKTTLLQLLCGLKKPDSGDIYFNNQSIYQQLRTYQSNINYIGHQIPLQNQLSISENWLLSGTNKEKYYQAINYFNLESCDDFPAQQLSSGQRKKAILMSLIIYKQPIWILDEPVVGLDKQSVKQFWQLVENHVTNNGLVILTSHQNLPVFTGETKSLQL